MNFYLILTTKCNLKCVYCEGRTSDNFVDTSELKDYDIDLPSRINYDINLLKNLKNVAEDEKLRITFYGGEPLLEIDLIKKIMDNVDAEYMIQTNGIFLNKLPQKYTNRFKTILVSIDGNKETNDKNRGKGTYKTIIKNLNYIKKNGFKGEIIARMVASKTTNIYRDVTYLLNNEDFSFNSVHWQIDAMFWEGYKREEFNEWLNRYNEGIKKLIEKWLEIIKKEKRVIKIYPFIAIVRDMLNNRSDYMRCGAGHSVFGIQTDGTITACPITSGYKPLYVGTIKNPEEIKSIRVGEPCLSCEIFNYCGGRCLYANKTKLWGEEGYLDVCRSVFFLINNLKKIMPEIKELIEKKKIKKEDFNFNRYNGCEIIP